MKICILALALLGTCCLCAQKRHLYWQEACFNNPGAPYCPGHEYAVKRTKPGAPDTRANSAGSLWAPETVDANGIDWRFADPAADVLAVLDCHNLLVSPVAQSLIQHLGTRQGLSPAEVQNTLRALSGVEQVAFSGRDDRMVLMVMGRSPDSVLPAPAQGWKASSWSGKGVLIGHAEAVDEAVKRLSADTPLGDLGNMALDRESHGQFWAAASSKVAAQQATAGVKRLWLTASLGNRLVDDTTFEFNGVPDANIIQPWLNSLGNSKVDGSMVYVNMTMEPDETVQKIDRIAASLLGQRLQALIQTARFLPVRDTAATKHTKPVIYGLDDGAKEVR